MPLVLKDRVKETSTTAGTGSLTLAGAAAGYQSFSVIGNGNTTYYTIVDPTAGTWEVGIGTYTSASTSLSRDTVLESSSGGSKVSFAANSKEVFVTYPAELAVSTNTDGRVQVAANSASPALQVTQTGAGNVFTFEDQSSDPTPFVMTGTGEVVAGYTAAIDTSGSGSLPRLTLVRSTGDRNMLGTFNFSNSANGPSIAMGSSQSNTIGSFDLVSGSKQFGLLRFYGTDGLTWVEGARLTIAADGTPALGVMPGQFIFSTTNAAGSLTEAGRINASQNWLLGGSGSVDTDLSRLYITNSSGNCLALASSSTNNTNKTGRITLRSYQTAEENVYIIGANNTSTTNVVNIGGGVATQNAATAINFYAAATSTTTTGTLMGALSSTAWSFGAAAGSESLRVVPTASAVNYAQVAGAATGSAPAISAQGSDTNIDLALTPKGTGLVRYGTYTGSILAIAGFIEIKDAAGTIRKLAVVA